jgi:hypothetical protein
MFERSVWSQFSLRIALWRSLPERPGLQQGEPNGLLDRVYRGPSGTVSETTPVLEVVLHGKLQLSRARSYSSDLTEIGRAGIACRVGEVRAVEDVVGIGTEVDLLLAPDSKVLGDGRAVGLKIRRAFRL